MKIDARLTFDKIRFDQGADAHLVLSLTAPKIDTDIVRPKLAMIVCVDTSSSMAGQKLEYAKLSINKLIDHLKPDDYLGIVSFSSDVQVLAKPTKLVNGQKEALRSAVSKLAANGMTNFSGGMLSSIDLLKNLDIGGNYIHRVIMFTDGQANVGPAKDPAKIIQLFQANAPEHITASAFGYGSGTDFSPEFLNDFAREGKGNYAHVEDPDKALKAFGTELGGLISTYATGIAIEVSPLAGHSVIQVVSDVDADEETTGEVTVNVPDILAEETRHIVYAVKLKEQKTAGPRAVNVFDVKMKYETFDSLGKKETKTAEAKAKVQFVKEGEEQKDADVDLDQIVGLAQLIRAQLEAEEQAKKGNYAAAAGVMQAQAASFNSRGRQKLAAAATGISERLGTQLSYQQNQGYLRSFAGGATRGVGVASYSAGADADLQQLGVVTSNSTQTSTADSFAGGAVNMGPVVPVPTPPSANLGALQSSSWALSSSPIGGANAIMVGDLSMFTSGSVSVPSAPVPHEANSDDDKKSSKPARKSVKQSRSKKNW